MNILSIIPARAGSKGIPNKNIRYINGHPLVYYAIKNAINSKYINDILVTTDSIEVAMVCKQMKVNYIMRNKELCMDGITLDAVVYDAIPKNKVYDYIVTMQPTSPTLKVDTLDAAIKYIIDNNYDTVISAINRPYLSWSMFGNRIVPNYAKRLNRQYLEPNYIETGAFLISKSNCVNNDTRIGNNVQIFPVSEDEAIDIDDFNDLYLASYILRKKNIAIYCNGNNKRGMGHIYRSLEIADILFTKPDIFFDKNQTDVKVFGNTTHNLIGVNNENELLNYCLKNKYDIFINDILATNEQYMNKLKMALPNAKVLNIEDDGEGARKADIVINALYENGELRNCKYGKDYYISPKAFMLYNKIEIKDSVKKVFICFGGADPCNYTDRILNIIQKSKYKNLIFYIAIGKAKNNITELLNKNSEKVNIFYDVNNMPELMSNADIAITSRGRTAFELALLGIPTIAMSQNLIEEKHTFISNENGYKYIGLNPSDDLIENAMDEYISLKKNERQILQDKLLGHKLRDGRERVISIINDI